MLSLIPILRIVSAIAVTYALLVVLVIFAYLHLNPSLTLAHAMRFAIMGALALNAALLISVHFAWRKLWAWFPVLGSLLFPDLNGRWKMTIYWIGGEATGTVDAVATIKQSFLRMSMEVRSQDSDSETLIAKPKKDPESGRPLLYYVYRVVPKQTTIEPRQSYEGAAILKFDETEDEFLSGNYFTSKRTSGRFMLKR